MNATKIKQLPDLNLNQTGITVDPSRGKDRAPETWYIHFDLLAGIEIYEASRDYFGRTGDHPIAMVEVRLPLVMVGGEDEIYQDIRSAVHRHAIKHLPPLA